MIRTFKEIVKDAAAFYAADPVGYYFYGRQGSMAVLKYFGEDSFGQGVGSDGCCVVAGYMTDVPTWLELARAWKAVLDSEPKIDYFRMRDCYDLDGSFVNIKRAAADKKLDALVSVIEKWGDALFWTESIITWDMFNHGVAHTNPDAAVLAFSHPYYFCAFGAMRAAVESIGRFGAEADIHFTFDQQVGMENVVSDAFRLIKEHRPDLHRFLGSIEFGDDRKAIPLQCADLLAWHNRRNYVKPAEDRGRSRPEWARLDQAKWGSGSMRWKEAQLKEFFTKVTGLQ